MLKSEVNRKFGIFGENKGSFSQFEKEVPHHWFWSKHGKALLGKKDQSYKSKFDIVLENNELIIKIII